MRKIFKNRFLITIFIFFSTICWAQDKKSCEQYFINYNLKHGATQEKIQLLKNKSNLKKLGTEVVEGNISGTLTYKTKADLKNFTGIVTMTWDNYCDEEGWIFNGQMITYANIKGDGNLAGTVQTIGKYNGTVTYDNVQIKNSIVSDGFYIITLDNNQKIELPYSIAFIKP